MKLNLGCGNKKIDGYVNIDLTEYCKPDLLLNLENTPYPFSSNSIEEIRMKSVIEHFPINPNDFFRIMKEIYRVCKDKATIYIECPHPSHRWQIVDLTHQKAIHFEGIQMLDKSFCEKLIKAGSTKSPLAIMYDIDYRIESYQIILDTTSERHIKNVLGSYDKNNLESYLHLFNNIAATQIFNLTVHKEKEI